MTETKLSDIFDRLPDGIMREVFAEPWQADTFALVVTLQAQGLFTWKEWSEALGRELKISQGAESSEVEKDYYLHALRALENLLILKRVVKRNTLHSFQRRWRDAARKTPHGEVIALGPDFENDFE